MELPTGSATPRLYTFPTTFYDQDGTYLYQEVGLVFLTKGDGVLWDGTRYRVADVWLSFDKHGHFDVGYHAFLEPIEHRGDDDRLARHAPDYFRS